MPVVRISNELFRKLQLLSEPLVDTPNTVIERVVDQALSSQVVDTPGSVIEQLVNQAAPDALELSRENEHSTVRASLPSSEITMVRDPRELHATGQGVFLAPASQENIKTTIARAVPLSAVEQRVDPKTLERLRGILGGKSVFHCWAMTTSNRGSYDNMKTGDIVLFTPKGTGRFTYRGIVTGKIESQTLGHILWPITPNQPWSLVYLLEDVKQINLAKDRLLAEFGYDRAFPVYGITRVAPERVASAIARRGNLESVLNAAAIQRAA